jgi:hypothetical protein
VKFSVETGWPPNIANIRAVLPVSERNIFAYGNVIFNPSGGELPPWLIAHEKVHFVQQAGMSSWWRRNGAEVWWRRFLRDPEFRLQQEVEAHRAEFAEFKRIHKDRNVRVQALNQIAGRLAKPMYGSLVSVKIAKVLIGGSRPWDDV